MRKRAKSSASRTTTYTHDNSGDLIQETTGTEVTAYEYDALGRMVQGTNAQGDISEYVYNGLGKRAAAVQTIQGANRANYGYRSCYNYAGYITDNGAYMSYAPVSVGAAVSTARGTNNYR